MYYKRVKSRAGYTLVELLVVIVISALLSSAMIVYSSKSRALMTLMTEEAAVAQVLQRARSLAISTYNDPTPPCAVGVAINYADNSYSLERVDSANCAISNMSSVAHTTLQRFLLPPQVKFVNDGVKSVQYVMFVPPDPLFQPWISDIATTSVGLVTISSLDGAQQSSIRVSEFGQINF